MVEKSARSQVSIWIKEEIEGKAEIELPVLAKAATTHFQAQKGFTQQLFQETVRDLVYELAKRAIAGSRSNYIAFGESYVTRDELTNKARKHSIFTSWLEHAGDRHVLLLDMTREDLLLAAEEREKRGNHELGLAKLWRVLADKLEGGQKVSDVLTAVEIEKLQEDI